MTVESLVRVAPPPVAPCRAFKGPWAPIEAELGVVFPPDYKEFVRLYGCGYFVGYLNVAVPRCGDAGLRLEEFVPEIVRKFWAAGSRRDRFWPSVGGLLPFGYTENAEYLFWLTRGPPDEWPIVVWDRDSETGFELFECDLTEFLAGLATGVLAPEAFPDLLDCDQVFQPNSPGPG